MLTEQLAELAVGLPRVQVPPGVKVTVPVGAVGVAKVSVTVAVHEVAWLTTTVPGLQLTLVVVGCTCVTVRLKVPELVLCVVSPP